MTRPLARCLCALALVLTCPPALLALPLARPQSAGAPSADAPQALEAVPAQVRSAMMAGDYEAARTAIDRLARQKPEAADFWCWLRGLALVHAGRPGPGAAELERFETEFVASPWRSKGLFLRAEALRELGRQAEAEALYERAVGELRSEARQRELAAVYLDFADALSTPAAGAVPEEQLDYARAELLYARTLDLDLPRDLVERAMFRRAHCKFRLQDWGGAGVLYRAYLEEFDPRGEAPLAAGRVPDAHQALGQCLVKAGDRRGARRTFEDLARRLRAALAPTSEALVGTDAARRRELRLLAGEADYRAAATWLAEAADDRLLGLAGFERLLAADPQHPRRVRALHHIAETYRALGRQEDALQAYDAVVSDEVELPDADDTTREDNARLVQKALFTKGQVLFEQGRLDEAIGVFTTYTRTHTSGADWAEAQRQILEAEYARGTRLRDAEDWEGARATWTRFLEDHPLDARAADLLFAIGELYHAEAEHRREDEREPSSKTLGLYHDAVREWRRLPAKYPGTNQASAALYRIGLVQETRLDELERAIETYRSCDFGSAQGEARSRLWQMTQESLSVRTEQVWRSNEPASVTANLRNVEELEVAIYPLDLEAYFRKHLTHRSIEELDLDLIAPEQSFTLEVEDYERYAALERSIVLPVEGPGVWAVALSTEERRATTLVIQSDVEMIVKSSRGEVFVFAEDMRQEAPAAGVDVLVALPAVTAGAPPTFHEARTGPDGVARLRVPELEQGSQLRVLAAREGHVASNGLSLDGLGLTHTSGPRWLVHTSRPAYRPGDRVHWRAILREWQDGRLGFEAGESYTVEVSDAQGRTIHSGKANLSLFGTLAGETRLDELAPTGTYNVVVRGAEGREARSGFQVERYRLESIELSIEFDQDVVFRGEEVEATLSARYYYGEPVVDSPIAYQLPDGRSGEVRTDAEGRASLRFDTRDFTREGVLGVRATLTQEGVSTSGGVLLALRGFGASLEVERELFLAGDRFQVDVATHLPNGEPTGRALELRVARLETSEGGRVADVLVSRHGITTDAESGAASVALQLERGGLYRLRVEGPDRFGNPVTAERTIQVSGDDDTTRLRILSDVDVARIGEELALDVHNRAAAGLALLTLEGESVLEYRLLRLEEGHNTVELVVSAEHDPNFVVAASMMRGQDFHQASADFVVERQLTVELEPASEVFAPGEEAVVNVRVTDALGRPARAELCLAVVDDALFETFADGTPALVDFFRPARRQWAALRTVTSCGFSYRGTTYEIAAEILAEDRRLEADKSWSERREQTVGALAELEKGVALRFGRPSGPATPGPRFSADEEQDAFNEVIGLGGGAGGSFGGRFGGKRKRAFAGEGPEGSPVMDADLAFWTPAVVTDENGQATVRFRVPERSTRWRMSARGADRGASMGEAHGTFLSRAEVFVELLAPNYAAEGDQLRPRVRVHNLTGETGQATVVVETEAHGVVTRQRLEVALGEARLIERELELLPAAAAGTSLKLSAQMNARIGAKEHAARDEVSLAVRPYGVEQVDHAAGVLRGEERVTLYLGEEVEAAGRVLEVHVGPATGRALIDAALGRDDLRPIFRCGTLHADAAGDLIGVCAVLRSMAQDYVPDDPELAELRNRAQGLVGRLVATQADDGGWRWSGRRSASHTESTCRALVALAAARERGLEVPTLTLHKARLRLDQAFTALAHSEDELKAMILFAQSCEGAADFSALNRLHRERQRLSPAGLAYTTRALVNAKRMPMAREVAQVLAERVSISPRGRTWPVAKNLHWNRSELEMKALALSALMESGSEAAWIEETVETLWSSTPWYPLRARGLVIAALSRHARWSTSGERYRVHISLNGERLETIDFGVLQSGRRLELALDAAAEPTQRITFLLEGNGRPHYSARLTGISPKFERSVAREFRVRESGYATVAPTYAGRAIPTGFGVTQGLGRDARWENAVTQAPLGQLLRGYVRYAYDSALPPDQDPGDYLVLDVPLPAGARVLEGSVTGGFVSYEERGGHLLVQVGQLRGGGEVGYTLIASDVGSWRAAPAVLRSAYEPQRFAVGAAPSLDVLSAGGRSVDDYRPTPDELFHLGKALYTAAEYAAARKHLSALYDAFADDLRESPLRETAEMMLFLSIRAQDSPGIVSYFEVLREKNPDLYVPLDDVLAVGRAYRELGEFERALLIFKAVLEESFGKDLKVAGTLEEQGEVAGSMATLERLWLVYPDSPAVRATYLALADKRLTKAPSAHEDDNLRQAGLDRAQLSLEGILGLQRFLAFYPSDPQAPDAALNLVSAHLDLEDYERVSELSAQMAAVYDEPRYFDAFEYSRAVAQWYLGADEGARELLARISEASYVDEKGILRPSQNRELALYILAQIFHARREYAGASEYYERVVDQFSDAREVLEGFREKRLSLPEITNTSIGEATTLELSHANVGAVELLAYRVDLMTLYLREKNLSAVTQVNLAGISPTVRVERALVDEEGPEDLTTEVELALDKPGAYLVICRGGELHASGLVLVTDIDLGVREDPVSGRLRVTATDEKGGAYISGLDVRVVGSESGTVLRGETDRRGLYVADGIGGVATVIARREGGEYAFFRGRQHLGVPEAAARAKFFDTPTGGGGADSKYFKNVLDMNTINVDARNKQLQQEIEQAREGVQVKSVK